MRYSAETKDRVHVKEYGFMSFARSMSNKYGEKNLLIQQKICYRWNKKYF